MQRAGMILALVALVLPQALLAQETAKKKYERDVITREEIQERAPDAKSAYDVIQRLRPQFLRTRPSGSMKNSAPVPVKVYVDGSLRGGTYVLRDLLSQAIVSITYFDGSDATTRFGTNHENGAILVKTGA
jgi:hypothetical protein